MYKNVGREACLLSYKLFEFALGNGVIKWNYIFIYQFLWFVFENRKMFHVYITILYHIAVHI